MKPPNANGEVLSVDAERARKILIDRLRSLQQTGVMQLPVRNRTTRSENFGDVAQTAAPADLACTANLAAGSQPAATAGVATEERQQSVALSADVGGSLFEDTGSPTGGNRMENLPMLETLRQTVALCTRCGELARTRTQTVFGVGNLNARLCFLGEAPGADEDRLGEPFVGRAGQLLTKIIEACKLKREDVYILNMLKCRPPGNRNPLPTELANCREYLERQLDLIRPEFICCCGAVAAQNLLNTTVSIGKLRGKIHDYRGVKVVCTYHPAFLLRSPAFKKEAWEDMKFLMREMGMPIE